MRALTTANHLEQKVNAFGKKNQLKFALMFYYFLDKTFIFTSAPNYSTD